MKIEKKDVLYFARIISVLLLITMLIALLLAFVNGITAPVIAANEEQKMLDSIKELFPSATDPKTEEATFTTEIEDLDTFYRVTDGGEGIGFCAIVTPGGFKGEVKMMVGIFDGKVCGIRILSHGETVGIGDKALNKGYLESFNGVADYRTEIDAVSGATYTSKAVKNGVRAALKAMLYCNFSDENC